MTDDPYSIPPFVGPTGGLSQSTRTPQPRPGSTPAPWIHVEFPGHGTFWIRDDALRGLNHSPLAPEDHIRDGELDYPACFGSDSYAHVYKDGRIMRYYRQIGIVADLKPIDRIAVVEPNTIRAARD